MPAISGSILASRSKHTLHRLATHACHIPPMFAIYSVNLFVRQFCSYKREQWSWWTGIPVAGGMYTIAFSVVNEAGNRHVLERGRDKGSDEVHRLPSIATWTGRRSETVTRSRVCIYWTTMKLIFTLHRDMGKTKFIKSLVLVIVYYETVLYGSEEHITSIFNSVLKMEAMCPFGTYQTITFRREEFICIIYS